MFRDGPPRMEGWSTWSGRERSSHSRFPPVPRVGLVTFLFLPQSLLAGPLRFLLFTLRLSIASLAKFNEAAGRCRVQSIRLCRSSLLIQFPDDLSSSRTQVAAEGFRVARRTGARGARAHARARRRASAPRLSVYRNPRCRQDDAVAHFREGAQLRDRRDRDAVRRLPCVPRDRLRPLHRLCRDGSRQQSRPPRNGRSALPPALCPPRLPLPPLHDSPP